jgi:hypothetical protein
MFVKIHFPFKWQPCYVWMLGVSHWVYVCVCVCAPLPISIYIPLLVLAMCLQIIAIVCHSVACSGSVIQSVSESGRVDTLCNGNSEGPSHGPHMCVCHLVAPVLKCVFQTNCSLCHSRWHPVHCIVTLSVYTLGEPHPSQFNALLLCLVILLRSTASSLRLTIILFEVYGSCNLQ